MSMRPYGQFCGLAYAMEVLGERWALLVVRELLLGPKRFTDLHRALPKIPTNILTARLKELEVAGVVVRRLQPRPGAVVYGLSEWGLDLKEIVLQLGRWGARAMGDPRPDDVVTIDSLQLALQSTFRPDRARGVRAGFELHVGDHVLHARVERGRLHTGQGALPGADLVLRSGPGLRAMMAGEVGPREAIASGRVQVTGDPAMLDRFVELFHIDPAPPVPAP